MGFYPHIAMQWVTPTVRLETCSQLTLQHKVIDIGTDKHFFPFLLEVLNVKAGVILCFFVCVCQQIP